MRFWAVLILLCLAPFAGWAGDSPSPALSKSARSDVAKVEKYLNKLQTLSADFMQIDDSGDIKRGTIIIKRPGKMRVNYQQPSDDFIIADGNSLHIWNDELQEQTTLPLKSTPAEFILREGITLDGDVTVQNVKHPPAKIEITLAKSADAGAGTMVLMFEDRPLKLRGWRVVDANNKTINVSLENVSYDINPSNDTFHFTPPNFGKRPEGQRPKNNPSNINIEPVEVEQATEKPAE